MTRCFRRAILARRFATSASGLHHTGESGTRLDILRPTGQLVPYREALAWQRWKQKTLQEGQKEGRNAGNVPRTHKVSDALFLVEHAPVYTLGRRSTLDNLRFDHTQTGTDELVRVERGGEVTWHGPGQLVGYPIVDLTRKKKDLHWFLRGIEEVIIQTLGEYGLHGERDEAGTGVWVGGKKVAAIGLAASRWVTMHGFAINVAPDLESFERIVPCGIQGRGVTSIVKSLSASEGTGKPLPEVSLHHVAEKLVFRFCNVFGYEESLVEWKCKDIKDSIGLTGGFDDLSKCLPIHR